MKLNAAIFAALIAMNFGFWFLDTVPVLRGVDTVVICFSLYGLSHIEFLMVKGTIYFTRLTNQMHRERHT